MNDFTYPATLLEAVKLAGRIRTRPMDETDFELFAGVEGDNGQIGERDGFIIAFDDTKLTIIHEADATLNGVSFLFL